MSEDQVADLKAAEDGVSDEVQAQPKERDWASEASSMGWNADYDGDNALDAREFVLRKPLYDEMKRLRKKTRDLETAIVSQQEMYSNKIKQDKDNIIKQLREQKKAAILEGDADKQMELDEELEKVRSIQVDNPVKPPPEYDDFVENNTWYMNDEDMTAWADAYGMRYKAQYPNKELSEIYAEISKRAKEAFPHKFKNPKREEPPAVEGSRGGATPTRGSSDDVVASMPKDNKVIAEAMWKQGAFGEVSRKEALKKYADDYVKTFGGW